MNDPSNAYAAVVLTGRDLRLDLFRGLALWLIFLDHIPSNAVSWITLRNYGFSDATEIFVFISGYTAAFVYGRAMRERGLVVASARVLRRVWQIYVAHVFLFVIYMAEIAYVSARFANPLYKEEMGVFEFLNQPDVTLVEALLLKFKPVNMDVLPLYIVLLFGLPPVLWLLLRKPVLALAASIMLYVLNWRFDLNLPAYPSGDWAFNPLAWQLLFVCGAWCALVGAGRYRGIIGSPIAIVLAAAYLVFAFAVTLTWWVPGLAPLVPKWLGDLIYPIDKANLDMLRFWHFVALAVITVRFVPRDWPALRSRFLEPVIMCGQHSLEIFCLGVFLAFAGHFIFNELSDRLAMQVLVSLAGIAIMTGVAGLISWYKTLEGRGPGSRSRSPDADLAGGEA